jgi:hypothetical protein
MKELNEEQKKEFQEFLDKQIEILTGHFSRCLLRCYNKLMEIGNAGL